MRKGLYFSFARLAILLLMRILWHVLARADGRPNPDNDRDIIAAQAWLDKYK